MHPVGGLEHQGERGEPGQRTGASDLQGEGWREARRESHQHRGGHQPSRLPSQDAHPVGSGQCVRYEFERRPAVSVQDHVPDH